MAENRSSYDRESSPEVVEQIDKSAEEGSNAHTSTRPQAGI